MLKQRRLIPVSYTQLNEYLKSVEADEPEDVATIREWMELKPIAWFADKSLEQIQNWMADNLISDLEAMKGEKRMTEALKVAAGVPSESDLEDAYNWVECTEFQGSEKQISWARSIAHKHHAAIVLAWKAGKTVPTKASWWIDNRNNIVVNLPLN